MKNTKKSIVDYQKRYAEKMIEVNEVYLKALSSKNLIERIQNFTLLDKLYSELLNNFDLKAPFSDLIYSDFFLCTLEESINNFTNNNNFKLQNSILISNGNINYLGGSYDISIDNKLVIIKPEYKGVPILNKSFAITKKDYHLIKDNYNLEVTEKGKFSPVLIMADFNDYLDILEVSNSPYSDDDIIQIIKDINLMDELNLENKVESAIEEIRSTLRGLYDVVDIVLRALRDNYTSLGLTIENDSMKPTKKIELLRQNNNEFDYIEFAKEIYNQKYLPQKISEENGFRINFNYNPETKIFNPNKATNLTVKFLEDYEEESNYYHKMIIESSKEFSVFDLLTQHKNLFDFVLLV